MSIFVGGSSEVLSCLDIIDIIDIIDILILIYTRIGVCTLSYISNKAKVVLSCIVLYCH